MLMGASASCCWILQHTCSGPPSYPSMHLYDPSGRVWDHESRNSSSAAANPWDDPVLILPSLHLYLALSNISVSALVCQRGQGILQIRVKHTAIRQTLFMRSGIVAFIHFCLVIIARLL